MHDTPDTFTFRPIAFVRSPYARRIDAPHQPTVVAGTEAGSAADAIIEFVADFPEAALQDLAGFERIWVVFAFDRSEGWKALVKPPRGGPKRGVLATRSPHRPNAIGLSAVELVAVEERCLRVCGVDLLDGTPILDIKPYVPYADAFPASCAGWIDAVDAAQGRQSAPGPRRPRKKEQKGDGVNFWKKGTEKGTEELSVRILRRVGKGDGGIIRSNPLRAKWSPRE